MRSPRFGKAPLALAIALVLVLASATPLAMMHWDRLIEFGRKLGNHTQAEQFLDPTRTGAPLVLAIGDSTLRPPIPFTTQMAARLGQAVEVRTFWGAALSPAEAALVASRGLELEPQAMILLAHFATFQAPKPLRHPELTRLVPLGRLPDVVLLPFSARGMGAGEIIVSSVAGAILPVPVLRAWTGGPQWFQRTLESRWKVEPGTDLHRLRRYGELRLAAALRTTQKVRPGHASIDMLRGAVHMTEASGTEVLVVISPMNSAVLEKHGVHDPDDLARRVQHVRGIVESVGGDVLDMHDALPHGEFTDEFGHYSASAAYRISQPVEAWTRSTLGLPTRKPSPRPQAP